MTSSLAELEQNRLITLNALHDGSRKPLRDGRCCFCGIGFTEHPLCANCEARRERLAMKYPEITVTQLRPVASGSFERVTEWSPHNSE